MVLSFIFIVTELDMVRGVGVWSVYYILEVGVILREGVGERERSIFKRGYNLRIKCFFAMVYK